MIHVFLCWESALNITFIYMYQPTRLKLRFLTILLLFFGFLHNKGHCSNVSGWSKKLGLLLYVYLYLVSSEAGFWVNTVFMHDPVTFLSSGSSAFVENQSLLHANQLRCNTVEDLFVFPCGLPVPGICCSVGSHTRGVFTISQAEKVPFFFSHLCLPYFMENL